MIFTCILVSAKTAADAHTWPGTIPKCHGTAQNYGLPISPRRVS
jgi:hypothetical protein